MGRRGVAAGDDRPRSPSRAARRAVATASADRTTWEPGMPGVRLRCYLDLRQRPGAARCASLIGLMHRMTCKPPTVCPAAIPDARSFPCTRPSRADLRRGVLRWAAGCQLPAGVTPNIRVWRGTSYWTV
ncbi:DUF6207 family protein [Streptomyces sp. DH10]|uniref:DUF6207 family protein n=1 Tax=Streptomyces sp. DH10 TaxID=3040121 RepID=UPI002441A9C9|nr:DUF6207 family protein [Streptomyces sp. DH10]MDG9710543.1 DUF6207 family protein [Streptomyces sp. DH10]